MLIAVTSQNFKTVTKHAGKTRRFLIYHVDAAQQIEEVDRLDLPKENSLHAYDRSTPHPVTAVDVLITGSCGEHFPKRLQRFDVDVMVTAEEDPLTAVHSYLKTHPVGRG